MLIALGYGIKFAEIPRKMLYGAPANKCNEAVQFPRRGLIILTPLLYSP